MWHHVILTCDNNIICIYLLFLNSYIAKVLIIIKPCEYFVLRQNELYKFFSFFHKAARIISSYYMSKKVFLTCKIFEIMATEITKYFSIEVFFLLAFTFSWFKNVRICWFEYYDNIIKLMYPFQHEFNSWQNFVSFRLVVG